MGRTLMYLARHGETRWNAEGRWQGHTDVPLNASGYAQALALGQGLVGQGVVAIVSSDLTRAFETARVVAERLDLPIAYVDPQLRERAFGIFEGRTREECATLHAEAWRAWQKEQRAPPGAESRPALAARMAIALQRVARVAREAERAQESRARGRGVEGAPILVVTHGAALRAAVGHVTAVPPPPIANGAIWRVEWEDGAVVAARPIETP